MGKNRRPVIALVATPDFKKDRDGKAKLAQFAYEHLYTLTSHFDVISTGRTHGEICSLIDLSYSDLKRSALKLIANDLGLKYPYPKENDLRRWRNSIQHHFVKKKVGVEGMIEVANELVQGRLDAIIQFSMGDDTTVRAGSAVLRREANVHDVPIASDVATAHVFVQFWKDKLKAGRAPSSLFRLRAAKKEPFAGLKKNRGDHVLALIAHNGRKTEMGRFVVEYSDKLRSFDHILATGHSGELAGQYLGAAGWTDKELKRILTYHSGPEGGDVEIAMKVIQGLCHNVFFFQDPATSHPHQADIRLFEQSILDGTRVRLASNAQSARILLEAIIPADTHE